MAFKFFQVPIREFQAIEAELNAFLRGHRILSVDRRWVDLGQDSFWSICVAFPVPRISQPQANRVGRPVLVALARTLRTAVFP